MNQEQQMHVVRVSLVNTINQQYLQLINFIKNLPFAADTKGKQAAIKYLEDSFVWAVHMLNYEPLILGAPSEPKKTENVEESKQVEDGVPEVEDTTASEL